MELLEKISKLYDKGIIVELSGETPIYAMIVLRGPNSTIERRLVTGDVSEDEFIDFIENNLVKEVEGSFIFP